METDREIRLGDWGQGVVESGVEDPAKSLEGAEQEPSGAEAGGNPAIIRQALRAGGMTDAQRLAHLRLTEVLPIRTHSQSWEAGNVRTAAKNAELGANIAALWRQGASGYEIAKRLGCTKYMAYQHIARLEKQ